MTFEERKEQVKSYLGKRVVIGIDRPIGFIHKKENYSLTYPINYGYIPGVFGGDGEELDVYLLGVSVPVTEYECEIIAIVHRHNDVEDKLVGVPVGMGFSKDEIEEAIKFQEQYYDTEVEVLQKEVKKISFKSMDNNEFQVYSKWSVKAYAEHLIKSGDEKFRFKALKSAKSEFNDIFPDGADSADNYLYIVMNKDNEKIGVIGYQKSPFEENAAFVTENVIKEEYRGKGYGKSAFIKIQEDAREKGFGKMVLNVFKHTPISYSMYEKNGFKVIEDYGGSVIMEKYL